MEEKRLERKPVRLIAAVSEQRGIGKNGKVPWNLPDEFQYFLKNVTSVSRPGKMNLMVWGKVCWYSNSTTMFPLPNILHVVLSKTMTAAPDHAHFVREDFDSAVRMAAEPPLADLIETIWVVGGTQVYMDAMQHPWCDLLYLTDVMGDFDCDVFFPEFDQEQFKLQDKFPGVPNEIQEECGIQYKFQVFKRETADGV